MDEERWLAEQFEKHRAHLRAVAYRILGSLTDADDAVQEAWARLSHSDTEPVQNLRGWLTTVVARICLNMLRSRNVRREEPLGGTAGESDPGTASPDPETEALLADSVGLALLVLLEKLSPPERLAFVLHDLFDLSFEEIAPIVGRSVPATRQLASRARRRVRGAKSPEDPDFNRRREVVEAFLAASRRGDFEGLLALLDPEVVLRVDASAVPSRVATVVRGARAVVAGARSYSELALFAQLVAVNGAPGILVAPGGRLSRVLAFRVARGRISEIEVIADIDRLEGLDLTILESEPERISP
jgi:RNA polymerase sigma-70 factor (ECF subfamily)